MIKIFCNNYEKNLHKKQCDLFIYDKIYLFLINYNNYNKISHKKSKFTYRQAT